MFEIKHTDKEASTFCQHMKCQLQKDNRSPLIDIAHVAAIAAIRANMVVASITGIIAISAIIVIWVILTIVS